MYVSIDATKFTFVRSENSHIVCMIWTTSNCTVTLNGKKYMNGTWIEQEGEYAFVITNDAKRSTTYKFMVDHYYAKYSMVAPTCTQKSYTIYKCMGCVGSYNGDYIEAKGHEYETKVVRDLHCETMDERSFYCTKCGAIITQNMDWQYEQDFSYIEYFFGRYQPYMCWVLLTIAGVWRIVMDIFFAIAQKNEEKEKARKMIKNYVIGLFVMFSILVACLYLVINCRVKAKIVA